MGPGATALGALLLLLGQDPWVLPHPQCLDYKPPFQPPQPLAFCPEYSAFGCCDGRRDAQLSARFQVLGTFLAPAGLRSCGPFLRDLLCQGVLALRCPLVRCGGHELPGAGAARPVPRVLRSLLAPVPLCAEPPHRGPCQPGAGERPRPLLRRPGAGRPQLLLPGGGGQRGAEPGAGPGAGGARGCLQLCLRGVANGLRNPVAMVHAGDGSHRFFVAEQRGCVWVFQANGSRAARPFLDLRAAVLPSPWAGDERGFLSLAFHPRFRATRTFYVYYSARAGPHETIRVSQFRASPHDPNAADPRSKRILLEVLEPASNHNGGQLLFGADELLYIFTGDGGRAGDPFGAFGNAQNKSSLLGKVLRIDVEPGAGAPPAASRPTTPSWGSPGPGPRSTPAGCGTCGSGQGRPRERRRAHPLRGRGAERVRGAGRPRAGRRVWPAGEGGFATTRSGVPMHRS
ncbi:unnamed protein product, partial [Caretta caretta]